MKRILMSLALTVATATLALADSYNYLNIAVAGSETSVALNQLKRITFAGDNIVVTEVSGADHSFALSDLSRLYFSDTATTVNRLRTTRPLAYENGRLVSTSAGIIQLYNAAGTLLRSVNVSSHHTEVSLSSLPHGIYIVKQGNNTLKIAK